MLTALLLLAFAVSGLAVTARAQQEPESQVTQPQDPQQAPAPAASTCRPDRILVKVLPDFDPATVIARVGGTIIRTIPDLDIQVVNVPAGMGQAAIDALSADPQVKYAEADGKLHAASAAQADGTCS
jgi:hypothetical protein